MKAYELMSLLEKLPAGKEVKVRICITLDELMHGQLIDEGCYMLNLDVYDITPESGTIETTL